jgi:M6 family metalloprotease-like protein
LFAPGALRAAENTATLSGILSIILGDSEKGESYVTYYLRTGLGEWVQVDSSRPLPLSYQGREVSTTGIMTEVAGRTTLKEANVTLVDPTLPSPAVSGTRKMAMLLLRYSDSVASPNDPTYYSNLMNPTGDSVNAFYREESYGLLSIQADIYGWYILPQPRSYYVSGWQCNGISWNELINDGVAVADNDVYFPQYDDVSFVMSDHLDGCAWGGGIWISADGVGKGYGATWMPPWAQNVGVYAHEEGHAIGCPHTGWVYGGYDSPWDVESGGDWFNGQLRGNYYSAATGYFEDLYSYDPGHHIAYHKIRLGWLDGWYSELSGGTTTITVNALAGPRVTYMAIKLLVPGLDPARKYFTVEARTKINYDQWLPGEGVIIHFVDEDRSPSGLGGGYVPAYPIDSTPGDGTLYNAQWGVGTTYSNSTYGLTISILSRIENSYSVQVTYTLPDLTIEEIWTGLASPTNESRRSGPEPEPRLWAGETGGKEISRLQSGDSFYICANVSNIGEASAEAYYIDAFFNGLWGRGGPVDLGAGEYAVWYWGPFTAEPGNYVTTWIANPGGPDRISESNYDNNRRMYAFTVFPAPPGASWTFMVYVDADNNLESFGIDDLNEMEMAGSTSEVNIIALIDRAPGYDSSNGDWTTTRIYHVLRDSDQYGINSQLLADLGEVNMGDPEELVWFTENIMNAYPANHYALVLWDHGSGWKILAAVMPTKGVCYDDTNGDYLTISELQWTLNTILGHTGIKIDLMGFDACLMQMIEVGYQIRDGASIMVGSEETEPGPGWPYDTVLTSLTQNPTMTRSELSAEIVTRYVQSYYGGVTLSSLDLAQISILANATDSFAQALESAFPQYKSQISIARTAAHEYTDAEYVDLYHFTYLIKNAIADPGIQNSAGQVLTAIGNTVIAEAHSFNQVDSHGVSIYFPETESGYFSSYLNLDFSLDTRWDEFLSLFFTAPSVVIGTVRDVETSAPLSGVTLELHLSDGTLVDSTTSGVGGYYELTTNQSGWHYLGAALAGYHNYRSALLTPSAIVDPFLTHPEDIQVLLVVDDDAASYVSMQGRESGLRLQRTKQGDGVWPDEIESALENQGLTVKRWYESTQGLPELTTLTYYPVVFWHCGTSWSWAVDPSDAETLIQYVASGGRLVLEGEDIGYDHNEDAFMIDVAHARLAVDVSGAGGVTITDTVHPVTQGLPASFLWTISPPYDDGVTPTNGGKEVIRYTGTSYSAVVVYDGLAGGEGRVVYIAFPLHALSDSTRSRIIYNSVLWCAYSPSSITLDLSAPSTPLGSSVTVFGQMTAAQRVPLPGIPAGASVLLSYSLDGATWNSYIVTQVDAGGAYLAIWYPPYPLNYQLRASWGGNANYAGATSPTASLTVAGTPPPQVMLLIAGPTSVARGGSAIFDVLVTNPGSSLTTTLYIEVTGPGGYRYFDTLQVSVAGGSTGRFQVTWQAPSIGGTYGVVVGLIPPEPTSIGQTQITVG